LHFPTGEKKDEERKEEKSEGKEVKTKKAGVTLAAGYLLQPLPQCSALLLAWLKDGWQCSARRNYFHQFHRRQKEREQ